MRSTSWLTNENTAFCPFVELEKGDGEMEVALTMNGKVVKKVMSKDHGKEDNDFV